ncbi:hypothetical protein [Streptomyces sp. NPDC001401]|uniref:hypothetical protein n=1 Tax=Streptomyces sp. NPDC001401 TaxID=3364570 RepID=UPI0036A91FB1
MAAPPQRHAGRALREGQDEEIFRLLIAGLTEREIAAQVGLGKSTVHTRITKILDERRSALPVDELITMRAARLDDLWRRAYTTRVGSPRGSKEWAAAWDRCLRAEESLRKLKGLDAPDAIDVVLERRAEVEADAVTSAVEAVTAVLGLDAPRRLLVLEAAAAKLNGDPLPEPPEPDADERADRAPWPVVIGGVECIWDPRRGCYREMGPERRPADEPFVDGEVVDEYDEAADGSEATGGAMRRVAIRRPGGGQSWPPRGPPWTRRTTVRTKKTIRAELATAVAEPEPDLDKIESLTAELRTRGGRPRLRRSKTSGEVSTDPEHRSRPDEVDQEAVQPWRPLVADMISGRRPGGSPYGRIID